MTPRKTVRMGRPPKPRNEKQSECIMVRVTKAERKILEKAARARKMSLSALLMLPWQDSAKES